MAAAEVGAPSSSSSINITLQLLSDRRSCSTSPHEDRKHSELPDRMDRRVTLSDHGKDIHRASPRVSILTALEGNIIGET